MDIYGNFATKIFNGTWFIAVKRRKQPKFLTTEHRLKGTMILMEYYAVSKHIYRRPQDTQDIHRMSCSFKRVCLNDSFFISTKRCITRTISIYEIEIMNSKRRISPDAKGWLIRKDPDAGKNCRQEEKGTTKDEMVGWHHRLDGHEFEQAPEVEGQGSLVCCNTWDLKELDTTEQLNWKEESSKEENLLVTHKPARWQYTVGLGQVSSEVCVCSEGYVHSASNRGEERVQDLYTENYNSLLRSIKKELNSWKTIPYSSIRRFNLIRCQYSMNRSKHSKNAFQNPRWCFAETDNQSKMHVENARGSK